MLRLHGPIQPCSWPILTVFYTRERYDNATAQLKQSMDRLEAIEKDEIIEAFSKSSRTYDEVMAFLRSDNQDDQNEE